MTDQIAVVTFVTPASPGTYDVTDSSLTETFSAAILIYSAFTNDSTDNVHVSLGIGFVAPDGGATTEEQAAGFQAESGLGTQPDTGSIHRTDHCIQAPDTASSLSTAFIEAQYSATITNGVRLNFTTTAVRGKCTAILFAGLTRAYTDGCTATTGGATELVGGTTQFEPDVVIFVASDNALGGANLQDCSPNLGFAINNDALSQVCAYQNADDATDPSDADGFVQTADAFGHMLPVSRTDEYSTVTGFVSNGFTHTASAGTPDAHYLALKFSGVVRLACNAFQVSASTGNQDFSFGFDPTLVLGMSTLMTSTDAVIDGGTASCSGYFTTGRHASRAYTWHHEEGITIADPVFTDAHTRQEDVALLTYEHQGTVAQRATWGGVTGTGFRLNFSTAAAGYLVALGIQLAVVEGDTETISDDVVLVAKMTQDDTETLSDDVVLVATGTLVITETVTIDDSDVMMPEELAATESDPAGWVYEPGTRRGTSLSCGADAGTVL